MVGVLENLLVLKTAFKQIPVEEGMQLSKFKYMNLSHLHMQQAVGKRKSISHSTLAVSLACNAPSHSKEIVTKKPQT